MNYIDIINTLIDDFMKNYEILYKSLTIFQVGHGYGSIF